MLQLVGNQWWLQITMGDLEPKREDAKRGHLRALLDRARLARANTTHAIKREPQAAPMPGLLPTPSLPDALDHHQDVYLHTHATAFPPPCSCSQVYGSHVGPPHEYAADPLAQWHYHPPLAVVIPPAISTADVAAIDHALSAHAATVSPSMSTGTSSSSSGHARYRARQPSPSSSRISDPQPSLSGPSRARKPAVAKLAPAAVASLDEYEDHELHSDFVHAVHMLIPADAFGCLMGHRGEYMQEINAASECTLSIRDQRASPALEADRVLRIYGKPKGICLAQRIVVERIRNFRTHKGDSSYCDLEDEAMVPMDERFVTSTISHAVDAEDAEPDKEVAAQQGSLRWLISKDAVGKIMGQNGTILRAIARDTDTSIHVVATQRMPPGSTVRAVIITGEPANVKRARAVIERKAGGRLETAATTSGKMGQYFVIPQHVAGFLIGPHGARIKKIREDTGVSIQIPAQHDLPLGYVNRTLHIQGTREQIEKARAAIARRFQSYLNSPESDNREDDVALQLMLPIRICSFLLDQRGRLIREITDKAGAHARFLAPVDDEHRVCVLYGDMAKVFRAERLVLQFIAGDAIANRYAGAGGEPPRKRKRVPDVMDSEEDDELNPHGPPQRQYRKRQHVDAEASGRIVVHYAEPTRPSGGRRIHPNERKSKSAPSVRNRTKRRR